MSAKKALDAFYRRELERFERESRPRRKNQKPELEVQRQVLAWLKEHGFSCHVVESKATYNRTASRYVSSKTTPGFSDITGVTPNGVGCFIELKAPGRRSTLRHAQRAFLTDKIQLGAFAVCVDSVSCLEQIWNAFEHRRKMDPKLAKAVLFRHLPPERDDVFEDLSNG
jgi:hypothetical protein